MKRMMIRSSFQRMICLLSALCILLICSIGAPALTEDAGQLFSVQITSGTLNIRDSPDLSGEVVGWLYPDDPVEVIGFSGGWAHVVAAVEAGVGWVKSEYLTTKPGIGGEYANDSGGRVRVRCGVGGKAIGWIKAGKIVTVTSWAEDDEGQEWAFIGEGYVLAQYLRAK